jgi:hypothetical protein
LVEEEEERRRGQKFEAGDCKLEQHVINPRCQNNAKNSHFKPKKKQPILVRLLKG